MVRSRSNTQADVSSSTLRAARRMGGLTGLITGLDTLTDRNLKIEVPKDTEKMSALGLDSNAVIRLRKWVNVRYREPKGKRPLTATDLKLSSTFSKLKTLCGLEDGS